MRRLILFLAAALAVTALGLRFMPGRPFALGPFAFTPATATLLAASILGLAAAWQSRRGAAEALLRASAPGAAPPALASGLLLGAIVAAGGALRLAHLAEFPLNGDEHIFLNTAHATGLREVWEGVKANHHPPANFFLLHYLQGVSVHPLWLRAPSLLAGVFLIWITAKLTREMLGPVEGLAAAALVAFSPALIDLSRVCRNYAPALAFMATALFFFFRYLRDSRTRDVLLFSLFECLALSWLYSVLLPFLAANIVLFGALALGRRPARDWIRPFVGQLPVAVLALVLYFTHIRVVSAGEMSALVVAHRSDHIFQQPLDYFRYLPLPLILVFQYLLAGLAGLAFFALALIGAPRMWISRRRSALALCLFTFILAYAFRFSNLLPLGGNRHSTYLFPLVIAPAVASIPALLTGLADLRRAWASRGKPAPGAAAAPSLAIQPAGFVVLVLVFLVYLNLSLGMQEGTVFYNRQNELPTSYGDLERALSILKTDAEPDDLILVSYQGLIAYNAVLNRTAMPYRPHEAASLEALGLRLHYSPEAGWFFSPQGLIRAFHDVRRSLPPRPIRRVWVLRGAGPPWEPALRDWIHHDFPRVRTDDRVVIESEGWLVGVPAVDLDALVPQVADIPDFYESDFMRSQYPAAARKSAEFFRN